jgi:hypothetical protein
LHQRRTSNYDADYSLQLIVESFFTGAKQVASATIPNKSFKLIDVSKTSLHFRKGCGMFCEGEWEQKRRFDGHAGIIGLVGFVGLVDIGGLDIFGQHTDINLVGHTTLALVLLAAPAPTASTWSLATSA